MARIDRLLETLTQDEAAQEATREGVASAVRVDDLGIGQRMYSEHLGVVRVVLGHDGRALRAVCDNNRPRACGVRLGLGREGLRDRGGVLAGKASCTGPRLCLGLVADDDIAVRDDLLQLNTEELGNEGCREVEREDLGSIDQPLVYWTHA